MRVVDGGVGDVAGVLGGVDVAEVVATGRALLEIGGEERSVKAGLGVGEEGLGLIRGDGVDGAEGETEEAVALVLGEFRTDGLGELHVLTCHGGTAHVYHIRVDIAAGGATVAVADGPCFAVGDCGSGGVGWVVDVVAGLLVGRQLG